MHGREHKSTTRAARAPRAARVPIAIPQSRELRPKASWHTKARAQVGVMTAQDTAVAEAIRKRQGKGLVLPLLLTGAVAVQLATAGQEQQIISNGIGFFE